MYKSNLTCKLIILIADYCLHSITRCAEDECAIYLSTGHVRNNNLYNEPRTEQKTDSYFYLCDNIIQMWLVIVTITEV